MKFASYLMLLGLYAVMLLLCHYMLGLCKLTDLAHHLQYDTSSYLEATDMLLNKHEAHPSRCIAFPLFLSIPYALYHTSTQFFYTVSILQIIMLFVSFIMIFNIIKQYTSNKLSLLIVSLLMLNVSYVVFAFHVLTEIGFLFFIMSAVYTFHCFIKKKNTWFLYAAFLCVCIATLYRPGMYYFNIMVLITLLIYLIFFQKNVLGIAILLLIFIGSIGIQIRMTNQQFHVNKISMIDDITMYTYMNTAVVATLQHSDKLSLMPARTQAMNVQLNANPSPWKFHVYHQLVKLETNELITQHTSTFILTYFNNLFSNFHTGNTLIRDLPETSVYNKTIQTKLFDYTRIWNMLMIVLLLLSNVIFILFCTQKKYRSKQTFGFMLLILLYCNYCFFTSGFSFFQGDRFNVVWMPILAIFMVMMFSLKAQTSTPTSSSQ